MTNPGIDDRDRDRDRWLLTLVFPAALEEGIVGVLRAHPDAVPDFTLLRCEGHGPDVTLRENAERVGGWSARSMIQLVIGFEASSVLLGALAAAVRSSEVRYWRTRLAEAGRLQDFARPGDDRPHGR